MPLAAGTHLGPYEIVGPLGSGGMGEVYRARDTRLDRTVAIKILPAQFSSDPVRKQRFEREAKTISTLNHPHICVLYDVGHQDGIDYLVMECVEGETLAKRLEKGPLPVEQVLKYGAQIADALDKAHRSGVVHRDLKPGNVMLTATGAKLLDFGLAKPAAPLTSAAMFTAVTQDSPVTEQGAIVGTFQYMSPEQVEGKELDGRSDIFSLGAVLYEMLTGLRAFEGKSQLSVASAILEKEPAPITTTKPLTPPALDRCIRRGLVKEPERRWQNAGDLASELQWIAEGGSQAGVPREVSGSRRRREIILGATAAVLIAALALTLPFTISRWRETPSPGATLRFFVSPPENIAFESGMALSPDGRQLVFAARSGTGTQLWLRPLDVLEAHLLPGTQNAWQPFWSPDARYLAFFADGKLKKMDVASGAVQTLCDAPDPRGGSWSRSGVIVFAPTFNSVLYQIPEEGGEASPITTLDNKKGETGHRFPRFLPDGRHFLFFHYYQQLARKPISVGSLNSKDQKQIFESASMVEYAPPGYLIYVRERTLVAQRFDARNLRVFGAVIPLAEGIGVEGETTGNITGRAAFTTSQSGMLAYRNGEATRTQLTWYDRKGKVLGTVGPRGDHDTPAISPDGKSAVVSRQNPGEGRSIWVYDVTRETQSRLTFEPSLDNASPVWSADGSRIIYSSNRGGLFDFYWKLSNGAAKEELLYGSDGNKFPSDVSHDGRYLIFVQDNARRGHFELWVLPLTGDHKPWPYLQTEFDLNSAVFSPDGHWVAYVSPESGRSEVFVQGFPETGAKFQISNGGADCPVWRADGKELFYIGADNKIMAVPVESGAGFRAGVPQALFPAPVRGFIVTGSRTEISVSRDGQKILVNALQEESIRAPITVVANWDGELRKK